MWVLVAALVGAGTFGALRQIRDGGFRTRSRGGDPTPPARLPLDQPLGERATLLQFSSAFCAPCRATRRVLGEVADAVPGVAHVEVDAEAQLDLVRRLGILRTPTTLILDADGREVARSPGAPTKAAVLATLARSLDG
jgi:thiol-disulfide isomerase/thioredoxin